MIGNRLQRQRITASRARKKRRPRMVAAWLRGSRNARAREMSRPLTGTTRCRSHVARPRYLLARSERARRRVAREQRTRGATGESRNAASQPNRTNANCARRRSEGGLAPEGARRRISQANDCNLILSRTGAFLRIQRHTAGSTSAGGPVAPCGERLGDLNILRQRLSSRHSEIEYATH